MRPKLLTIAVVTLSFALPARAQVPVVRVSPDEALSHLEKKVAPVYPPLAERALIQGNIILEIRIDETGAVSSATAIRGHPMLIPSAVEAAKASHYRPFELNGRPVSALSFAVIRFGDPKNHDAEDSAEVRFLNDFWTAEDSSRAALARGDEAAAEQSLTKAHELFGPKDIGLFHARERWDSLIAMGELRNKQHRYDEAERSYNDALAIYKDNKEFPQNATTLQHLGSLHFEQQRYDIAANEFAKSTEILQKNFKQAGAKNASAQAVYGRRLATNAWMQARIAQQMKDSAGVKQHCAAMTKYEGYLDDKDRVAMMADCNTITAK